MSDVQQIEKWVRGQGYPLELRTAKAFREAKFDVQQVPLYTDDGSNKTREIDLIAMAPDLMGVSRITFVIECKSSDKPWVLFTSKVGTAGHNIYWTYSLMSEATREVLSGRSFKAADGTDGSELLLFERLRWLKKDQSVAYSFRQAFSNTDAAYTALVASIKAASHLIGVEHSSGFPHFRVAFPVVVVDSPLFLCTLDASDQIELTKVPSGEVLFTNPDQTGQTTCIRVVTAEALPAFVSEAKQEIRQLQRELRTAEASFWEKTFGRPMPDTSELLDEFSSASSEA